MIKFFLLLIILFIFYFKNEIKESFVGCLPRYYNQEATVIDNNDIRHYGIIRNSSTDNISIEQINSDDDPVQINKDNIRNIVFNNCPNEKTFLPFLEVNGESVKIPCDVRFDGDHHIVRGFLNANTRMNTRCGLQKPSRAKVLDSRRKF